MRCRTLPTRGFAVIIVCLTMLCAAQTAAAEPPESDDAAELDSLESEIEDQMSIVWPASHELDCRRACKALEAMLRAAERICRLDPGPRCAAAREKVAAARRHVRDQCPDCLPAREDPQRATDYEDAEAQPDSQAAPATAGPQSETRGAGCAACRAGRADSGQLAALGWALTLVLVLALRRRRRKPPRH
jgi:MYXO-CTERM domain-containing protein